MIAATAAIFAPAAGILAGLTYATVAPSCGFWGPVVSRGPAGSHRVAITFDDGPTPGATDVILDVLRDAGVRATFFVIGVNVRKHPGLLRRIHAEGHLVANHSFNHSHYGVMRLRRYWLREIIETDAAIEAAIGVRPAMYRPPVGLKTGHTFSAMRSTPHAMITWSRRAIDGLPTTPQRIMGRFRNVADGEILLLHDGVEPHARNADRSATIAAVPMLLDDLRRANLAPVRLDELLGIPGYQSIGVTAAGVAEVVGAGAAR
ncbi:MAG: peptidoglycan-N-acetylglucosamine deacetylase [Phycisphaerales bacterium]|jgi:peptidoglycan/xylan/chitin deacetylase (PgdA/CDA1 family)|nr:peptidoglycan-N-acetylglucosamine deacetylase [Phycisphaerales bacterium]